MFSRKENSVGVGHAAGDGKGLRLSLKYDARTNFKKYINHLATTKTEGDEKFLILKPKYSPNTTDSSASVTSSIPPCFEPINSIGIPVSPIHSVSSSLSSPNIRQPPPYRPPPPPPSSASSPNISYDNISISSLNNILSPENVVPQAPPRRRSSDKGKQEHENVITQLDTTIQEKNENDENQNFENDKQPISVKERTQKFNRMASVEDELSPRPQKEKKKVPEKGADEDDGASVTSLEQKKCTEWLVTAAKGDYQELAKLAADEPRLVKLKVHSLGSE
ncbi:hypothetical protein FQA39_LY05784 [Lamprigera yunnana]|nr:hypothetical protein FQA39_LY05784 [Lamprigera yunnana]